MTGRKKKLIIAQLSLLLLGIIIILYTYTGKENRQEEKIISQEAQKKINAQLSNNSREEDIFFNIEYSGLDLAGNRYILKTAEAYNNRNNQEIVNLKSVEATFYFKNDKVKCLVRNWFVQQQFFRYELLWQCKSCV